MPGFYPVLTGAQLTAALLALNHSFAQNINAAQFSLFEQSINTGVVYSFTTACRMIDWLFAAENFLRNDSDLVNTAMKARLLMTATPLRCTLMSQCPESTTTTLLNVTTTTLFRCADGRDPDTLLCSRCLSGYYMTANQQCSACPSYFGWLAPLVNSVLIALVLTVFWTSEMINRSSGLVQITTFWYVHV